MHRKPLAVFRCDAGASIGGGHVVRCSALADALVRDGWLVGFAVSNETLDIAVGLSSQYRVAAGYPVGAGQAARLLRDFGAKIDLVVVDHYGIDIVVEAEIRSACDRLMVIDDKPGRNHNGDLLLDYSIGRRSGDYESGLPLGCNVLAGADFALLRDAFRAARLAAPSGRMPVPDLREGRIVVALGLADGDNVTETVLRGLAEWGFVGRLDVVLGAGAPHRLAIERLVAAHQGAGRFHPGLDANGMAVLLSAADLVIGAAGTSTMERLCLGRASLVVMMAENQRDNYDAVLSLAAARGLGDWRDLSPGIVSTRLGEIGTGDVETMQQAAFQVVDGLGAARVALALRPEIARDGRVVSLRRATAADAEMLYRWQLEPATRAYARSRDLPTFESHVAWLERRLAMPRSIFNIVLVDGEPAGVVRLDSLGEEEETTDAYEVSIHIAERFHGQGSALAALSLARRLVPDADIHAGVLQENRASSALFAKAGYTLLSVRRDEGRELRFVSRPSDAISPNSL